MNALNADTKKASDLQERLTKYYEQLGIKERKDNVLMMEFIVSASPEFFDGKDSAEVEKWAAHQVEFMKKEFGGQLKIAVLHLDEKTPHLHFMVGTEMETVKKYRNQKGEFHKKTWSLNAKRYNPEFLIGLHDRHAEWNKRYGLKRGVRGSMREHTTLKEFYKIVDKAMKADYEKTIENVIEKMETGLLTGKVSIDEVREKFKPMINGVLKQNKALREKYALDIKQWASDLSAREVELDRKEMELSSQHELYSEAMKTKMSDYKQIETLKSENESLKSENERLRTLYEPQKQAKAAQPSTPNSAKIAGR